MPQRNKSCSEAGTLLEMDGNRMYSCWSAGIFFRMSQNERQLAPIPADTQE
jgi:hypothetical protein